MTNPICWIWESQVMGLVSICVMGLVSIWESQVLQVTNGIQHHDCDVLISWICYFFCSVDPVAYFFHIFWSRNILYLSCFVSHLLKSRYLILYPTISFTSSEVIVSYILSPSILCLSLAKKRLLLLAVSGEDQSISVHAWKWYIEGIIFLGSCQLHSSNM